ncbi:MAG TPA: zinc ribbon domain-containing protein [Actinomycetota bacterium]|nr:zinc ribbon domain-containing protein [Actinomycetota bacterium]
MGISQRMQKCPRCNASVPADAAWCNQCYHRFVEDPKASVPRPLREFEDPDRYRDEFHPRYSRWRASQTTMGPVGRILATLLFLVPLPLFFFAGIAGYVGVVLWVSVVLPMAFRSIWKKVRVFD